MYYRGLFAGILGLTLLAGSFGHAQPIPGDEKEFLEAVRSGKIRITDDLIESQKLLHPEFRNMSNADIRAAIQTRAAAPDSGPSVKDPPAASTPDRKAEARPTKENPSRFPSGLERFGYDFFNNNANSGVSSQSPALPDYVLAPGDEIQIYTWGRETQNRIVPIDNEGMLHFPPLAPLRLAGMKFSDAQKVLTRELQKINGLNASIGLGKLKSIRVFVLGEAVNPGSYVVSAGATVTSALFQSGGITPIGSLRRIQLKRNDRVIATLDLYDMLMRGNNRTDQQLLPGDVIFVPVAEIQVAVTGTVKRPGIYEVKSGMKVLEAIDLAGGLSSNAFKGRVRLDRIELHKRKVVLDVGMEMMGGTRNVPLQDGDILHVDEVLAREYDVVYLEGNVNRPGRYEYKKGMAIRDLIPGVKDLKSETFFAYGHIKRATDDDQRSVLLPFSLKEVFENNASVPLMPRDTVMVYSRYDIMDKPEVKIVGSVRKAGSYPFVDKMRISDLIIAGGGLTLEAYLPEAQLIRVLRIEESDSLFFTLLKVDLTHLIDNPGDPNNLDLRPSDSLIIFPRSNFVLPKEVSIHGSVKDPGRFSLTKNMGIPELISQASGLTKTSYATRIEVVRKVVVNDSAILPEIHQLNLRDVMAGKTSFALQDGDAVYIRNLVDEKGSTSVIVSGEFNFPGSYQVTKGERLSQVVRRAGGFSEDAYLRGAVFIRKRVKDRQLEAIEEISRRLESQMQNMVAQTTNEKDKASIQQAISVRKAMLEDIRNAPFLGRVVIDLDRDLEFAGGDNDLTLEDGDSLFVESIPNTVSILGEVFSPTNVVVGRKIKSVGDGLDMAGGVNEYGDKANIYYIKPDGSVITPKNTSFFRSRRVEPGGVIIVPPKGPKRDYLDALTKITQVIYQIAISVGVAKTVFYP